MRSTKKQSEQCSMSSLLQLRTGKPTNSVLRPQFKHDAGLLACACMQGTTHLFHLLKVEDRHARGGLTVAEAVPCTEIKVHSELMKAARRGGQGRAIRLWLFKWRC